MWMSFFARELPMVVEFCVYEGIEIPVEVGPSFQDSEEEQTLLQTTKVGKLFELK